MVLRKKRTPGPVAHPPVNRMVTVRAPEAVVRERLAAYGERWAPERSHDHRLGITSAYGWTGVRLPTTVHPWQLHSLATWLVGCRGCDRLVMAISGPSDHHGGYVLVPDPEIPDALCGWDEYGEGWTVSVSLNRVARPEPVPVPPQRVLPLLPDPWKTVTVRLEEPGHSLHPTNAGGSFTRQQLRGRSRVG